MRFKENYNKSIPRACNSVSDKASIYFCVKNKMMVIISPAASYHLTGHLTLRKLWLIKSEQQCTGSFFKSNMFVCDSMVETNDLIGFSLYNKTIIGITALSQLH